MGWTSFEMHRPIKVWFKEQYSDDKYEVLDIAFIKFTQLYAAIRNKATGEVYCATYMISYAHKSFDNFAYKSMTEHMGPNISECPERILKLLTPLTGEDTEGYAKEWRERCWRKIEKAKELKKAKNKVIMTENPLSFNNGRHYQYFKKEGRGWLAGVIIKGNFEVYTRVRLHLASIPYTILN